MTSSHHHLGLCPVSDLGLAMSSASSHLCPPLELTPLSHPGLLAAAKHARNTPASGPLHVCLLLQGPAPASAALLKCRLVRGFPPSACPTPSFTFQPSLCFMCPKAVGMA